MTLVRVHIGTTEGPAEIQRLTPEPPEIRSVVCLDGRAVALPISRDYESFIRRPTGIVERLWGGQAFRMDVGARITDGLSWQLGAFIAHALNAAGRLAEKGAAPGAMVWATGEVDAALAVRPVEEITRKLRLSVELLTGHAALRPWVIVPAEAEAEARAALADLGLDSVCRLLAVGLAADALTAVDLILPGASRPTDAMPRDHTTEAGQGAGGATEGTGRRRSSSFGAVQLLLLLILIPGAAVGGWKLWQRYVPDVVPSTDNMVVGAVDPALAPPVREPVKSDSGTTRPEPAITTPGAGAARGEAAPATSAPPHSEPGLSQPEPALAKPSTGTPQPEIRAPERDPEPVIVPPRRDGGVARVDDGPERPELAGPETGGGAARTSPALEANGAVGEAEKAWAALEGAGDLVTLDERLTAAAVDASCPACAAHARDFRDRLVKHMPSADNLRLDVEDVQRPSTYSTSCERKDQRGGSLVRNARVDTDGTVADGSRVCQVTYAASGADWVGLIVTTRGPIPNDDIRSNAKDVSVTINVPIPSGYAPVKPVEQRIVAVASQWPLERTIAWLRPKLPEAGGTIPAPLVARLASMGVVTRVVYRSIDPMH